MCSEAALCALRRRYPQIYSSSQKLVLDVSSIAITNKDFMCAMSKMVPASQRYNQHGAVVHLYSRRERYSYISSSCIKANPLLNVDYRAIVSPAKSLIPAIRPLLSATLQDVLHIVGRVFPHAEQGLKRKTQEGSVICCLCCGHLHASSCFFQA